MNINLKYKTNVIPKNMIKSNNWKIMTNAIFMKTYNMNHKCIVIICSIFIHISMWLVTLIFTLLFIKMIILWLLLYWIIMILIISKNVNELLLSYIWIRILLIYKNKNWIIALLNNNYIIIIKVLICWNFSV